MKTVISVSSGTYLPLWAARSSLLCVSLEVLTTRLDDTTTGHQFALPPPACATPKSKDVCTHARVEPSRVRRRLLQTCLEDHPPAICRHQVTTLFCTRWSFVSAFSARSPYHFGSQADVAISVFLELTENTVLPRYRCHYRRCSRSDAGETVCGCVQFCFVSDCL